MQEVHATQRLLTLARGNQEAQKISAGLDTPAGRAGPGPAGGAAAAAAGASSGPAAAAAT